MKPLDNNLVYMCLRYKNYECNVCDLPWIIKMDYTLLSKPK
jgi:hypothetical protein